MSGSDNAASPHDVSGSHDAASSDDAASSVQQPPSAVSYLLFTYLLLYRRSGMSSAAWLMYIIECRETTMTPMRRRTITL